MWICKKCGQPQYTHRPDVRLCPKCGGEPSAPIVSTQRTCFGWLGSLIGSLAVWLGWKPKAEATVAPAPAPTLEPTLFQAQPLALGQARSIDQGVVLFREDNLSGVFLKAFFHQPAPPPGGPRPISTGVIGSLTLPRPGYNRLMTKLGDASRVKPNELEFFLDEASAKSPSSLAVVKVTGVLLTSFGEAVQVNQDLVIVNNLQFMAVTTEVATPVGQEQQ